METYDNISLAVKSNLTLEAVELFCNDDSKWRRINLYGVVERDCKALLYEDATTGGEGVCKVEYE